MPPNLFGRAGERDRLRRLSGESGRVYRETLEFLRESTNLRSELCDLDAYKVVGNRALQRLSFNSTAPSHRVVKRLLPQSVPRGLWR